MILIISNQFGMQLKRSWCYALLLLCCPLLSMAQQRKDTDTIIPDQTIEIIQNYKPEVVTPEKPEWTPRLNIIDTTKPVYTYEVPQQALSYSYHSIPLRPLAMGRVEQELPFSSYVKAGLGNLSTFLLDAGTALARPNAYEGALHLYHLSQKGNIANQQSSVTEVNADGKYYFSGHAAGAAIHVEQRTHNYYGYNHSLFEYDRSAVHQSLWNIAARAELSNTKANKWDLWYQPEIRLNTYSDRMGAREQGFDYDVPVRWQIDSSLSLSLSLAGNFTGLTNDSFSVGNNFFQIKPALRFRLSMLDLNLGVNPTWGQSGKGHLLPDLYLKLHTVSGKFAFIAGWKGAILQNTYEQLSTRNPFLYNIYPLRQTWNQQILGGFELALGRHLNLNASLSWRQWDNMALFVNDYTLHPDGKYFTLNYDDRVQAIALDADLSYQFAEQFQVSIGGVWTNFLHLDIQQKAWMEPMLKLSGSLNWQVFRPLSIQVRASYWDGMYAREALGTAYKMPVIFDLGAGAEYRIISRISLFLQADNITGQKYQRWYQYPVYGTNVTGGLRVKF